MSTSDFLGNLFPPQGITSADVEDTYDDFGVTKFRIWALLRGEGVCILDGVALSLLNQGEKNFIQASNAYVRDYLAAVEPIEAARTVVNDPESTQPEIDAANAIIAAAPARVISLETLRAGEPDRWINPSDHGEGETAEWLTWDNLRALNDQISLVQIDIRFYIEYALRHGRTSAVSAYGAAVMGMAPLVKQ